MDKIIFEPIGVIKSEYEDRKDLPRQSHLNKDSTGEIQLKDHLAPGLKGISLGEKLDVVFHFNRSSEYELITLSKKTGEESGIFFTRSPHRPNGIGISVIEVTYLKGNVIGFKGVDMLNNTPVLDIKPHI